MSDYTKTVDFAAKDALASGNPAKAAKGTEVDTEFDNIAVAVATKYDVTDRDVANGIAPLDAGALVPVGNLPVATEVAIGALEIATTAEADGLLVDDKIITPLKLDTGIDTWAGQNAGSIFDLHEFVDPGFDVVFGWDFSGAQAGGYQLGNGITTSGGVLLVAQADISLVNLGDYDANDHIDHTTVTMTAGNGLTGGGTIAATRTFDLDISALSNVAIAATAATDSILVNNGGVMEQMDIQDMGIRVVEETAIQTFALGDANTMQLLTGATPITWDIPTDAAVPFGIGTVIYLGSRDTATLTISPNTSAVRLTAVLGSDVGPSAGDRTVAAGGIAALVKVATNEWMLTGDIG